MGVVLSTCINIYVSLIILDIILHRDLFLKVITLLDYDNI